MYSVSDAMVSEEIIYGNENVQQIAVSSTSLYNIWDTVF
jgi:hypothetical protein